MSTPDSHPSRLSHQLGLGDAVVIGLGSMIGAGVAYCNATSSAQLAAFHPESGGTYVYGRKHLGTFWGYLAGWGFGVGKTASCVAMALTFGAYAIPGYARPLAIAAVVAITAVNYLGVAKTAGLTRVIVVIAVLAVANLRGAIGFSSFAVLTYYGIANACAWTLSDEERR